MWVTMMATKDDDDGGGEGGDCGGGIRNSQRISFIGPAARPSQDRRQVQDASAGIAKKVQSNVLVSRPEQLALQDASLHEKMFRFTSLSASTGGRRARRRRPWKLRAPSGCTFAG